MRAPDTKTIIDPIGGKVIFSEKQKVIYLPYNYNTTTLIEKYINEGYRIRLEIA